MLKFLALLGLLASANSFAAAEQELASPIQKVISLLNGMADKVKAEGASADKAYEKSKEFCEKRDSDLKYSIKTAKGKKEELESRIENSQVKISESSNVLEEAATSIANSEADLEDATEVRKKEKADFAAEQKELVDTMTTLEKALMVLQKQEASGKTALLQVQQAPNVMAAVETMVSASMISTQDASGLTALLQKFKTEDEEFQPEPAAYEKKSGGIIDMIEDLYDKSKSQLAELRQKEQAAVNSYQLVAQSLNDEIKYRTQEQQKARANQADAKKALAENQKALDETVAGLNLDTKDLKDLVADCRRKAEEYAADSKDTEEELTAVGKAIDALKENAMGASAQQYGLVQDGAPASFLQLKASSKAGHFEIVHVLRNLANKEHSNKILLLAQRIGVAIRSDKSAAGPFDTIINMIKDMVANMQKSLQEDTDKKQYCDTERAKVKDKKDDKQDEVDKLTSKIDSATSTSVQLKNEAAEAQQALTELAKDSKEMAKNRADEKAAFEKNQPEMAGGLKGVKIALKVLRDYYQASGKSGGAVGIIGMLEVCESDFAKALSDMKVAEKTAQKAFEKETKEMKMEKVKLEADVKYKSEEAERISSSITELQADSESLGEEMAAIIEYSKGIEDQCSETAESFAEKAAKRQAEIDGLKTALATLSEQAGGSEPAAFVQVRALRGNSHAVLGPF